MRVVADFHLHSKFSRATSKQLTVENMYTWSRYKGLNLIGTADFTHPAWIAQLKEYLHEEGNGLLRLKSQQDSEDISYMLTGEISSIYTQGGKMRRIHNVLLAPSFAAVDGVTKRLAAIGNISSDGRPIFGIPARDLLELIKDVDERNELIPAHAWTPWFSLFGSNSGFDSIEECFGDMAGHVFAIETGLSSDPPMNWRLPQLDSIALISCGDGHSLPNIGREATVFELPEDSLDYDTIINAIKNSNPLKRAVLDKSKPRIDYTIEFYPEEGKYHVDGHRACDIRIEDPAQTKKLNTMCPKCHRPLTIGVLHRVEQLADPKRPLGFKPKGAPGYKSLVQLDQIIAEALCKGEKTQTVRDSYLDLINNFGGEFSILVERKASEFEGKVNPRIVEGIQRVQQGEIHIVPGYDGVFGTVRVFNSSNQGNGVRVNRSNQLSPSQGSLF